MSREEARKIVLEFLSTISADDVVRFDTGDDVPFEESGLIDSVAMLEVVTFLEKEFAIDFSKIGIHADDLGSVENILDLIER